MREYTSLGGRKVLVSDRVVRFSPTCRCKMVCGVATWRQAFPALAWPQCVENPRLPDGLIVAVDKDPDSEESWDDEDFDDDFDDDFEDGLDDELDADLLGDGHEDLATKEDADAEIDPDDDDEGLGPEDEF